MNPILFVTKALPTFLPIWRPGLGRLMTPRHYPRSYDTAFSGLPWAADNDCFTGLDPDAYERMLDAIEGLPLGRFVTVPDVVGDANATADLFDTWHGQVRATGVPVALVAQDGLTVRDVPWRHIGALFIGGTTGWKYGDDVHRLAAACRRYGKWLHFGRVNTRQRTRHALALGANSIDGSAFSKWSAAHIPWALDLLNAPPQLSVLA